MNADTWFPHIDQERCMGCGDCIVQCPRGALGQRNGKAALVQPDYCTYCSACEDVCPAGAIELPFLILKFQHKEKRDEKTD